MRPLCGAEDEQTGGIFSRHVPSRAKGVADYCQENGPSVRLGCGNRTTSQVLEADDAGL